MSQNCRHSSRRSWHAPYSGSCIAVVLAAVLLAGCSRSSFLGRQFDDLTARFNTHYNANRTFNEAERKLLREDEPIDMDRYLLVFQIPAVSGRSAEFEKVIEKSADLLRKHPHSKWVDDALMLIGKSYFYQSNYVGAEQKFNEVIALGSGLHDEAMFWLARTLVASQSGQDAEDLIRTALASENLEDKWRPRLHLLLGDLRTDVGDWEGAIDALEAGLEDIDDGDLAARADFLLGQLYETVEDYPAAIEAYKEVRDRGPLYELMFASMYSQYRVEGLYRDPDVALEGLQKMARDNKHYQYLDRIRYLQARVYAAMDDPFAARRILRDVLYPEPGQPATSIRGEIHYRLAEIDRDLTGDFYSAAAHFDTAASALRTTNVQNEVFTPDAIVNARETAEVFSTYRQVAERVAEIDSLLHLGSLDPDAFDEAVRKVREQLAIEAARAAEEIERRQAQTSFRRVASESNTGQNVQSTTAGGRQAGRYGFLNHKDIRLVQEAFLSFRQVWGDRPLVPGWRREEVILATRNEQQDQLENPEGAAEEQSLGSGSSLNFLPPVDISQVPRDSASRVEMKTERSAERYKLANILFLSMGLPDSAATWYRRVIDESDDESVILRARYAMAEVHQALGDFESADRLMAEIVRDHPESVFADRARVSLGIEIESERSDSLELALQQYSDAYRHWNDGRHQLALNSMIRTAADYPKSEIAAKALLAGAAIFSDMARDDSLDLFGLIPVGDSVFTAEEIALARVDSAPDSVSMDSVSMDSVSMDLASIDSVLTDSVLTDSVVTDSLVAARIRSDSTAVAAQADDLRRSDEAERGNETLVPAKPVADEPEADTLAAPDPSEDIAAAEESDLLKPRERRRNLDEEDLILRRRQTETDAAETDDEVLVDERPRVADLVDTTGVDERSALAAVVDTAMSGPSDTVMSGPADTALTKQVGPVEESVTSAEDTADAVTAARPPEPPAWIDADYYINDIIPQPLTLHSLFASVEDHFAESEFGIRASELKRGLIAYRDESFAPPDTTAPMAETDPIGSRPMTGVSDSSFVSVDD